MLMAASTEAAFKSGIFFSAISRICALVMLATLSRLGRPEAVSRPQAFLINTAAGGVFVMKVKERVQDGMRIISGMELSSYSDTENYIHLACYFPKTADLSKILEEMDSHVREVRVQRCKTILGKLEQDGYHIPYSDIEAKTKDCYPSLPVIAQCLLVFIPLVFGG